MNRIGLAALAAYVATIPAANWLIAHVGTCFPDGPCVIPVGFGLDAPSGVLSIGLALVLRDLVQRQLGAPVSLLAILLGTALSATFAPPALVLASGSAFLLSELVDFGIFTPLQRRGLVAAVLTAGAVGAVVDSAVFLWVAFGSLDFLAGQVLGKVEMCIVALPLIRLMRKAVPA